MMGHMGKAGYEEWREMRRDQQIDRGEIDEDVSEYKRSDTDGYKGNDENFGDRYASGSDATLAQFADGKTASGTGPKPRGRNLTEASKEELEAHLLEERRKHTERYNLAHWKQESELINAAKTEDIWRRKIRDARSPDRGGKFVAQKEKFVRSRAPRDVDNHLFTGAVHKEAESEQEMIARKFENNEISLDGAAGHKATEALKDEMDAIRRQRSGTWKDKAVATSSDSEVAL